MEKFIAPMTKNDWEVFNQSIPSSNNRNVLSKTFLNLTNWVAKWELKKKAVSTSISTFTNHDSLSISEQINVPETIIHHILEQLIEFENTKGYLDRDIDLPGLARNIGTNHSYLSRVVNNIKGKPFKQYLNDMRIEYAYIDLQTDPKKRRYTVEAIAFENGFRSAESFSKKFKNKYHLYPSEFLAKLNESSFRNAG